MRPISVTKLSKVGMQERAYEAFEADGTAGQLGEAGQREARALCTRTNRV